MIGSFKQFTIDESKFADTIADARLLDAQHYAETETKYMSKGLNPDYPRMIAAEKAGQVAYFTAYDGSTGKLVAHLFYYVEHSAHSAAKVANEDRYYIVKEHRGSGLARRLLQYAADALKARGVTDVFMSSKAPIGGAHIDLFLETEGFKHVANVFHKVI